MAKLKHCYYCAANTTFQGKRCSKCKKHNSHENKNAKWDRVRFKELKQLYNGSFK